jgi:hypothetical protein
MSHRSLCAAVPGMEPQYKTPAAEEHGLFTDSLLELKGWLEKVTGLTKGPKGALIPNTDPNAERANYDGEKLKGHLGSMINPLMDHVRPLLFNTTINSRVRNDSDSCAMKSSTSTRRRSNLAG